MAVTLYVLAWLLSGFAGAYIGHRWADKGAIDTTLGSVTFMCLFGPGTLLAASLSVLAGLFDSDKVVFKRKSK